MLKHIMLLLKNKLFNTYVKNVITLSFGTLIAQAAMIAVAPVLTRIYTPGQLGTYTLVMTIASIAGPLVNGRYDVSVVSASCEREANAAIKASIIVCFFTTIFSVLIMMCLLMFTPSVLAGIGRRIYFVIPLLILFGFSNTITSYNNRHKDYKLIASVSAIKSLMLASGQAILGILKTGIDGLLISQVVSMFFSLGYQFKKAAINIKTILSVRRHEVKAALKKFRNQPLYSTPALLLYSLSYSIIPFLIGGLYSLEEVGYYSITFSTLGVPIQLFSLNVSKVFFRKANEEKQECGTFYNTFKRTLFLLLVVSIPLFTFFMLFATGIFRFVFGPAWARAGLFVEILSPMYAFRFISASLSLGLIIGNRQKIELLIHGAFFIQAILTLFLAKNLNYSIEQFLTVISVLFTISYLVLIFAVFF